MCILKFHSRCHLKQSLGPFGELLRFPGYLPCMWSTHIIELLFVFFLLICPLLQINVNQEPRMFEGSNEASMKIQKQWVWGAFRLVNTWRFGENKAWKFNPLSLYLPTGISFSWLFLSYILLFLKKKSNLVSKIFLWVLWATLGN